SCFRLSLSEVNLSLQVEGDRLLEHISPGAKSAKSLLQKVLCLCKPPRFVKSPCFLHQVFWIGDIWGVCYCRRSLSDNWQAYGSKQPSYSLDAEKGSDK